jgi:hypothetical protein
VVQKQMFGTLVMVKHGQVSGPVLSVKVLNQSSRSLHKQASRSFHPTQATLSKVFDDPGMRPKVMAKQLVNKPDTSLCTSDIWGAQVGQGILWGMMICMADVEFTNEFIGVSFHPLSCRLRHSLSQEEPTQSVHNMSCHPQNQYTLILSRQQAKGTEAHPHGPVETRSRA